MFLSEANVSDGPGEEGESVARSIDWRGWLVLAWVLWFGGAYVRMVAEERGQRIFAWFVQPVQALLFGK